MCPHPGSACGGCIADFPFVDDCPSTAVCDNTCYYGEIGDCSWFQCWYCWQDPNKPIKGECCDVECTGTGWKQTPNNAKCPVGTTCDANCQCVGEAAHPQCNDGIDNDGDGKIDFPSDPGCTDANDNDETDVVGACKTGPSYNTCQEEGIKCPTCSEQLIGGLVPCGRTCDDPCTAECECEPCTLCHLFVLFKRIVDFLAKDILFPLAVLMIIIGGVMFLTAAGNPERIGTAKKILTSTVMGLVIIFLAWLIVDTIIMVLTPANSPFRNWNEIDCPLPEEAGPPEEELPPGCTCTDWVDVGCGTGGCAGTEMHKTRTCNPAGCAEETGCFADITCGAHTIPGCPSCILCP
jgi:hypothetical protein